MASFFFGENMKKFSKRRTDAVKGLRRYRFLFPPKNKYCLVGLKRHPDNWQLVVLTLCRIYNCFHSTKNKCNLRWQKKVLYEVFSLRGERISD